MIDTELIPRVVLGSRSRPIRRLYVKRQRDGRLVVEFRLPRTPFCAGVQYRAEGVSRSRVVRGARLALALYVAGWRVPFKIVRVIAGNQVGLRLACTRAQE